MVVKEEFFDLGVAVDHSEERVSYRVGVSDFADGLIEDLEELIDRVDSGSVSIPRAGDLFLKNIFDDIVEEHRIAGRSGGSFSFGGRQERFIVMDESVVDVEGFERDCSALGIIPQKCNRAGDGVAVNVLIPTFRRYLPVDHDVNCPGRDFVLRDADNKYGFEVLSGDEGLLDELYDEFQPSWDRRFNSLLGFDDIGGVVRYLIDNGFSYSMCDGNINHLPVKEYVPGCDRYYAVKVVSSWSGNDYRIHSLDDTGSVGCGSDLGDFNVVTPGSVSDLISDCKSSSYFDYSICSHNGCLPHHPKVTVSEL